MPGIKSEKFWGRLALVTLVISTLFGCGPSSSSPTSHQAEVEFWTMQLQPQFTDYFNDLITQFEGRNPGVKIRWVDVPWSAMESKILTAVAAKNAPDVVNLNPDFAALLAGRNAWLDLNPLVSEEIQNLYLPNILKVNQLGDKTFGIPWYLTTQITIYNQNLLQQAGISQPPGTYQELALMAKQIKEKTGKYGFFISFVPEDAADVLQSFGQMGVPLVDDQGQAAFNTPEGRRVFQYWVDLYQQGLLPPEVLTQGHRRAIELYQAGELALLITGPQFFQSIAKNAPSIAAVSAPAPQITGETGKRTVAVMNLVIPQDSDVPQEALDFALFVTNDQNQLAFAQVANVLPSRQAALKDPYFQKVPENTSPEAEARIVSAQQMSQAELLLPAIEDVKKLQKIIYNHLQAAMLKEKTVDQAVADAATAWNNR